VAGRPAVARGRPAHPELGDGGRRPALVHDVPVSRARRAAAARDGQRHPPGRPLARAGAAALRARGRERRLRAGRPVARPGAGGRARRPSCRVRLKQLMRQRARRAMRTARTGLGSRGHTMKGAQRHQACAAEFLKQPAWAPGVSDGAPA
jgi:hypothetical protein